MNALSRIQSAATAALARWVRQPDKLLHYAGEFVGAYGTTLVAMAALGQPALQALAGSAAGWGLIAWAKERYGDKPRADRHTYDGWDAYAGAAGGLHGAIVAAFSTPALLAFLNAL